jgi:5'-3' exonuclease
MAAGRAWLIDASIYIFRAWFSMPDRWQTPDGQPVHAVYGYARFLLDFLEQTRRPRYCAAAFDESLGTNYRNAIYPDYKCSRELPDEDLAFQLAACRELTELLGMPAYGGPRYEADDYIASLARLFQARDVPVTIVTRDKDLGQVMRGPDDNWWDFSAGELIDADGFEARFGVRPQQFADFLGLVGDPVDDIPGVPGVGQKTAAKLLQAFPDLDALASRLDDIGELSIRGASRVAAALQTHWGQALVARQLARLADRVPGIDSLPELATNADTLAATGAFLAELGLGGPLARRCEQLAAKWGGA